MVTVTDFRAAFPEFSDLSRYPDAQITFWMNFATAMVNPCRWGTQTAMGIYLYTAHEITLAAQSVIAAQNGGAPGSQAGIANSKTVGSVTVGYDSTTTAEKNAGWYNLTNYGKQFFRLMRMFGAGAVQL